MCGIVGAVGTPEARHHVLAGLKTLEYRGYDSAGIACLEGEGFGLRRVPGKIAALEDLLTASPLPDGGTVAIGHTRWATHGEPSERNAHPHLAESCAVVHNGIIENYLALRERLGSKGYTFNSDTDSETVPALVSLHLKETGDITSAMGQTLRELEGAFALGILFKGNPDMLMAARRGAPLVVGLGKGCNYIASDPMALAPYTNRFIFLENDDIATLTPESVSIRTPAGEEVSRPVRTLDVSGALAGKAGYRHFMLKEIHEQPAVVGETLQVYLNEAHSAAHLPDLPFNLADIPQITLVACGTAFYAGLTAKYWFEELAGVPVNVDVASEFRYRKPPLVKGGLTIVISQSGETADTLAALHYAKENGQRTLGVINVPESSIARDADTVLYTRAGQEVAVASTKAFTTQLTVLLLLALETARVRGSVDTETHASLIHTLTELPARMGAALDVETTTEEMARGIMHARSAVYIGRGSLFPIALEGALKLKEISYIHAEGFAAGEMKHGPIALIDEDVPIITLAPHNTLFEKTLSNMKEAEARRGNSILITDPKGAAAAGVEPGRTVLTLPTVPEILQPLVYSVPVQLLAYHVATLKGTDVDQPRNLAKSVTVE